SPPAAKYATVAMIAVIASWAIRIPAASRRVSVSPTSMALTAEATRKASCRDGQWRRFFLVPKLLTAPAAEARNYMYLRAEIHWFRRDIAANRARGARSRDGPH